MGDGPPGGEVVLQGDGVKIILTGVSVTGCPKAKTPIKKKKGKGKK